ncbi:MAG: EAL domain-containing protein [Clostridiales bacterium]|nr:EAL domain-containing protein [Clostridiales bacterium]
MSRRRIALLCGQPEEYCQELFIQGFNSVAIASDMDVCVFSMYQKYQDSPEREVSDSSIFDVINFSKFDGVIVLADSIQTPGVYESVHTRLKKEYKGKVIIVEGESDVYPVEYQDNYYPIRKLIDHLIEVHNYTDIAFLTGKSWHPHSKKRLKAFKDSMADHGLDVKDSRVFYGDFWYTSGESVAERITKPSVKLPQAVACANDAMAIGLAKALVAKGYRIPEDIAVIGYDSNDEGKHAPLPLTSADIPLFSFGEHSANDMISLLNGGQISEFVSDADLFIGRTCGCNSESAVPLYTLRDVWDTQLSGTGVYSVFNHMNEDVVSQANYTGLINTIFSYIYQIRPFDHFSLCINSDWQNINDKYNTSMIEVIKCGNGSIGDSVNFDVSFDLSLMLPDLYDDSQKPMVYYFLPFTFDDKIFGYTAIGYEDPLKCIDDSVRLWNRTCMIGFEVLRRSDDAVKNDLKVQDGLIKDNLTGLYNYQGLLTRGPSMIALMNNRGGFISALAVDVKDLSLINQTYGRAAGDKVIINVASLLESVFFGFENICVCLGNGEFIALRLNSSGEDREILSFYDQMKQKLDGYNANSSIDMDIELYYGIESGKPESVTDLERLINTAISKKNSNKVSVQKARNTGLTEEEQAISKRVNEILETNRINYHFQPIVRTTDGEIFAYEALMRPDSDPYISPPDFIHYAELSGRLDEIEKDTFFNVLDIVESRPDIWDGTRKVFINSIPGQKVSDEDRNILGERIKHLKNTVVVELTEQSELTDEQLGDLKELYSSMGVNTAVDDYGTGYSNVTNLLRYMPKYVKIDRMLLSGIQDSPQKQHFVKDIISFSHDNGIMALAEGVETVEELQTVIFLGADLIQGYYTARPSADIVQSINPEISKEIKRFHIEYEESSTGKCFVAGREGRILLPRLSEQEIELISVSRAEATFIDFTVAGSPELMTNIRMNITNGYKGRITLDNAGFGNDGPSQAINIDNNSEVTLVIKGENRLHGGINVSKGSVLRIEGDGYLSIDTSYIEAYGIGSTSDNEHGDIYIEDFEGTIDIKVNGVKSCAIGSGRGGKISISSGKILINAPGRRAVAIGNLEGFSDISIKDAQLVLKIYSMTCVGIGSIDGTVDININNVELDCSIEGKSAMVLGDFAYKSQPVIRSSKFVSSLRTELLMDQETDPRRINFVNGSVEFNEDGVPVRT